jgi:Trk-type K+ transport system membrane component
MLLLAAILFYGVGRRVGGDAQMSFLDAVFLGVTSATGAGLGNVVMSRIDTFQQVLACLLIIFGSQVWVAACVVNVQRALLARKILKRCREEEAKRKRRHEAEEAGKVAGGEGMEKQDADGVHSLPPVGSVSPASEEEEEGVVTVVPSRNGSCWNLATKEVETTNLDDVLKERDQERLQALTILSWLVPTYLVIWQLLGTIIIGAWTWVHARPLVASNALNPWWFATFNSISSFNNSGMSLLDANMTAFLHRGALIVWTQTFLIIAGNSGFPIFLKALLYLVPKNAGRALLLDPARGRKVFPYIFNTRETIWLSAMLIILNGIDWAAFMIFSPYDPELAATAMPRRLLAALFQAVAVRSGGFAIVTIKELHVGVLMAYAVMLYISAIPISLPGVPHAHHAVPDLAPSGKESAIVFVWRQLRGLTRAGDLRYLAAAVWCICVIEGLGVDGIFPVVFEVASAFGCVGVSFGDKTGDLALVGGWKGGSKLLLAAVMLFGRVREVRRGILKGWTQEEHQVVVAVGDDKVVEEVADEKVVEV